MKIVFMLILAVGAGLLWYDDYQTRAKLADYEAALQTAQEQVQQLTRERDELRKAKPAGQSQNVPSWFQQKLQQSGTNLGGEKKEGL